MGICRRCGGSGKLQAGFSESGQSQYMTCEACWGTGRTDSSNGPPVQGCLLMLGVFLSGFGALALLLAGLWQ